jgi:predicted dienelactone hydrolase
MSFLGLLLCCNAGAFTVGERHLLAHEDSAKLRDSQHSDQLRITVWYPAADNSRETPLTIGPEGHPFFLPGTAAQDAAFADDERRSIILLSHGFGGTARVMAWFGTALARAGYVVIAVDHPGNNGLDPMTVAGAVLFWERPGDLAAALKQVEADQEISRHLNVSRIGVAGFSVGGFTSLAAAGGRVDVPRFSAFCEAHPDDGVCRPQREFQVTHSQAEEFLSEPENADAVKRSQGSLAIPGIKAVFVMAPACVQSFDPASLNDIAVPVKIVLGDSDDVAPPFTNGEAAARLIPKAQLEVMPGVGHYDFLSECTSDGNAALSVCPTKIPRDRTHQTAIKSALAFFNENLGAH